MRPSLKLTVVVAALAATTAAASLVSADAASDASPRRHVVEIQGFKFVPETLTIRQGDTVEWINRDIVPHTATTESFSWDTGNLIKDQSNTITFSTPGSASYICQFHPNMRGEITVSAK